MTMQDFIQAKCPVCRQGAIFKGFWTMNDHCPNCEVVFEREQGFFIMSIYMAYGVDVLFVAPFVVYAIFAHKPLTWLLFAMAITVLLLTPFTLRFTRTLWLYLDEWMDPRSN